MPRTILTVILTINLLYSAHSQSIDTLTSEIFFNIDIKNHDTSILSELKKRSELTLEKEMGRTSYPPMDEKGNLIPYYTFTFSNHPYFTTDFSSGRLMVMTTIDSGKIIGMLYRYLTILNRPLTQHTKA